MGFLGARISVNQRFWDQFRSGWMSTFYHSWHA